MFVYECVIHPGMEASVRVVRRGRPIPSATAVARVTALRLKAQAKLARKLGTYTPPANTISGGNDKNGIVLLRFFPKTAHVAPGQALTLQVTSKPEVHTFSFGPEAYLQALEASLITPIPSGQGPPVLQFSPLVAFPSEPPPLPPFTGTQHGNGFYNTGILDGNPASPFPSSVSVTFTTPGTYGYVCLIHPFMHGTVVVG